MYRARGLRRSSVVTYSTARIARSATLSRSPCPGSPRPEAIAVLANGRRCAVHSARLAEQSHDHKQLQGVSFGVRGSRRGANAMLAAHDRARRFAVTHLMPCSAQWTWHTVSLGL